MRLALVIGRPVARACGWAYVNGASTSPRRSLWAAFFSHERERGAELGGGGDFPRAAAPDHQAGRVGQERLEARIGDASEVADFHGLELAFVDQAINVTSRATAQQLANIRDGMHGPVDVAVAVRFVLCVGVLLRGR